MHQGVLAALVYGPAFAYALSNETPGRVAVREPPRGGTEPALTRMAAAATRGADGRDDAGYRDYRGVTVVGVWRWIPELGFGVAAEMDRDEPASEVVSERRRR